MIQKSVYATIFFSHQQYAPDEYETSPIIKKVEPLFIPLSDVQKIQTIKIRRNVVYSNQMFTDLGFSETSYQFDELNILPRLDNTEDKYWLSIMLDPDIVEHQRSIYTIWDALGDIGGLFDMLKLLALPNLFLFRLTFGSEL